MINDTVEKLLSYRKRLQGDGHGAVLVKGAAGNFTLKITGAGVAFIAQIVVARLVGSDSYGYYIYVLTWINLCVILGKFGFDRASLRFIASYHGQKEWGLLKGFLRYSIRFVIVSSVSVQILLVCILWFLRNRISSELLSTFWIASAMLPVMSALFLKEGELRGLKKVVQAEVPRLLVLPLIITFFLPFGIYWFEMRANAITAMIINVGASLISLVAASLLFSRKLPKEVLVADVNLNKSKWFEVAKTMLLLSGFTLVFLQTDIIMVGAMVSTTDAGVYSVASRVATFLTFIVMAVNSILAPLIADIHSNGSKSEIQRVVTLSVNVIFFGSAMIAVLLFVSGKWILGLFGEGFSAGYLVLVILILGKLIASIFGPSNVLLDMTGYHKQSAKLMALGAVFNIFLNFILIPLYGAAGAASATAIAICFESSMLAMYVWRKLGIVAIANPLRLK